MIESYNIKNLIPQVSIDCVVFGYEKANLKVLLSKLDFTADFWTLSGGFINQEESIDEAALRILENRTGLHKIYLEQFKVYGETDRTDNRFYEKIFSLNQDKLKEQQWDLQFLKWMNKRFLSIGYYALVDIQKVDLRKSVVDESIDWYDVKNLPELIFDHGQMVKDALEVLRFQLDQKLIAFNLLPETFTMKQLQKLYEAVHDRPFPNNNFQKKILSLDILERLGKKYTGAKNKAPYLYRFKDKTVLVDGKSVESKTMDVKV